MELSGKLTTFSLGDILQWAYQDRRTGAVVVGRSHHEKRIYLSEGVVVDCVSDDPAEVYGQYLLLHGHITDEQLRAALSYCTDRGTRLGTALVEMGHLSRKEVRQTLHDRIFDAVCDAFLWPKGLFFFDSEARLDEELLPVPIDTMGLVLEGTRWIDEHARMRRVLVHDDVVLSPGANWPPDEPSPLEARIVAAVDGERTLAEVYRESRGSYFRFLEAVYKLCLRQVLDVERVGEDSTPSTEVDLYDLLLGSLSREAEVILSRRHLSIPLEQVLSLVPIWLFRPSASELAELPEPAADLFRAVDGQTAVGELISAERDPRRHQLGLIFGELQRGRLALLPDSLTDLKAKADQRGASALQRWWQRLFSPDG